jgi:hypothetical protein
VHKQRISAKRNLKKFSGFARNQTGKNAIHFDTLMKVVESIDMDALFGEITYKHSKITLFKAS